MSYEMIDRVLRNNLYDDDYTEHSAALDALIVTQRKPLTVEQRNAIIKQECRYTSEAAVEDYHRLIDAVELQYNIKE